MAEVTKKALVISFSCVDGSKRSLTINKPASGLDGKTIGGVMDEIIGHGCLCSLDSNSPVSAKEGAKFVIQQEDKVTLS